MNFVSLGVQSPVFVGLGCFAHVMSLLTRRRDSGSGAELEAPPHCVACGAPPHCVACGAIPDAQCRCYALGCVVGPSTQGHHRVRDCLLRGFFAHFCCAGRFVWFDRCSLRMLSLLLLLAESMRWTKVLPRFQRAVQATTFAQPWCSASRGDYSLGVFR